MPHVPGHNPPKPDWRKEKEDALLWDMYAAAALTGLLANEGGGINADRDYVPHAAAAFADKLLLEREQRMAVDAEFPERPPIKPGKRVGQQV